MKSRIIVILLIVVGLIGAAGGALAYAVKSHSTFLSGAVQYLAEKTITNNNEESAAIFPTLLGLNGPRTMLLLFLNNTEIRPGGGFIGSYGVVTVDHGSVTSLFTDGVENLDRAALNLPSVPAPQPLTDHVVTRWYFRDSNWSPDFVESSQKSLGFYKLEQGQKADEVQTVIGITPEVLSTLLKYTGPISVDGKNYTTENITDLLEHTVEVDFHEQGIAKENRKDAIGKIAAEIVSRTKHISPTQWGAILGDVQKLFEDRHVMVYDTDPNVQKSLDALGWSGRLKPGTPDKIMFADANLGSLKTDRVMQRSERYEITRDATTGQWQGTITMQYKHTGTFDWKTTRYQTYTRWYFPSGTTFLSADGLDKKEKWIIEDDGAFMSVGGYFVTEPGATHTITIHVALAPHVVAAITAGKYGLVAQKQLGTSGFDLTVHALFGTSIKRAAPPEEPAHFGDNAYDWSGRVTTDTNFEVLL
ncbi:MAG: DUF4012 domain-containing protein [Candidatus Magasanikbacteria bacterium]|nr:DUF4012 domain-containing protein [Candidatus Magasanikbacteria bacterium]